MSLNNNHHHDPGDHETAAARLTAYALGQLDEPERAAVEAELTASPKAQESVRLARLLANHVCQAASHDESIRPSASLRQALEERLNQLEQTAPAAPIPCSPESIAAASSPPGKNGHAHRRLWVFLALAACLLVTTIPLLIPGSLSGTGEPQVAMEPSAATKTGGAPGASVIQGRGPEGGYYERVQASEKAAAEIQKQLASSSPSQPTVPGPGAQTTRETAAQFSAQERSAQHRLPPGMSGIPGDRVVPAEKAFAGSPAGMQPNVPIPASQGAGAVASNQTGNEQAGALSPDANPSAGSARTRRPTGTADAGQLSGRKNRGKTSALGNIAPPPEPSPTAPLGQGETKSAGAPRGSIPPGTRIMPPAAPSRAPGAGPPGMASQGSGSGPYGRPAGYGMGGFGASNGQGQAGERASMDAAMKAYYGTSRPGGKPAITQRVKGDSGRMDVADLRKGGGYPGFFPFSGEKTRTDRTRAGANQSGGESPVPDTPAPGTEQYEKILENDFTLVSDQPLSTFSVDVDTASYANVRRFLRQGMLPPVDAVRIEEMVNYFRYNDAKPKGDSPFSVNLETAPCPWNPGHRLVRIGLKGREVERTQRGPSNLVFLLDVSGSMDESDKLPLVKQAMKLLVNELTEDDRVAIVTYASSTGVRLESTNASRKETILECIDSLTAGGSTNGGEGIQLAYEQAVKNFRRGGTNRVILATDGDLNVGITQDDELVRLIQEKAKSGVFLTVLGVGTGNLKDSKLEKIADKGNGIYAYLDNLREAQRVLVEQISGSLVTIAKDVKIQVEFNPAEVQGYRLIGYENRQMAAQDFHDDRKDAGEIGAGHNVTALYEILPRREEETPAVKGLALKYQRGSKPDLTDAAHSGELLTLRLRYKTLHEEQSKLIEQVVKDSGKKFGQASRDFQFAAAVASFGMLLRNSPHAGHMTFRAVEEIAASSKGDDPGGYRAEFVDIVHRAEQLRGR